MYERGKQYTFDKGAETAHCAAERTNTRRVAKFMLEEESYQGYVNNTVVQQERVVSYGFQLGSSFIPRPRNIMVAVRPGLAYL